MAKWSMTVALVLGVAGNVSAQPTQCVIPRRDLVSTQVSAVVSLSAGEVDYQYSVTNKADAHQTLISFAGEAFTPTPPVQTSPPAWEGRGPIVRSSSFVWDTFVEPRGLQPGASASGFGFRSAALPTVARFLAWGNIQLPRFPEGVEPESCANSDIIENSFKGVTVGRRRRRSHSSRSTG